MKFLNIKLKIFCCDEPNFWLHTLFTTIGYFAFLPEQYRQITSIYLLIFADIDTFM
jgi:hypothetical protein